MNFNYSYRAFLITCLLTGCLVLILYSIKLQSIQLENDEITYDVEFFPEEMTPEEELEEQMAEGAKIETHKARNEAERFPSSFENQNQEITQSTQEKLKELDKALAKSQQTSKISIETQQRKKEQNNSEEESNSNSQNSQQSSNKNTTISYMLINRTDLFLPNPVYTCNGSGKVVINIEVDQLGIVKKCFYNKNASTTVNQCLIDAATKYASQARFSTDASRTSQLGTITFNFPGQ